MLRAVRSTTTALVALVFPLALALALALATRVAAGHEASSSSSSAAAAAAAAVAALSLSSCTPVAAPDLKYTWARDYLRAPHAAHASRFRVVATDALSAGAYPNLLSQNGSSSFRIAGAAAIDVDAATKRGVIEATAFGWQRPSAAPAAFGEWRLRFDVFGSVPLDENATNVRPVMQGGVARDIAMHGCTHQGEPTFPRLACRLATWGNGSVALNGSVIEHNVYAHVMLCDRSRDPTTHAVYADCARSQPYSPVRCNASCVDHAHEQLIVVAAPLCFDAYLHKLHPHAPPLTAQWVWYFDDIVDVSPPPPPPDDDDDDDDDDGEHHRRHNIIADTRSRSFDSSHSSPAFAFGDGVVDAARALLRQQLADPQRRTHTFERPPSSIVESLSRH